MLVAHFIFSKQNFRYFIADQFMIYALGLFHSETKINFLSLMNAYPGDMIFLVFVNTPPEIAEERRMKRKEKGFVWEDSLSEFDRLNLQKRRHKKLQEFYSFFKSNQGRLNLGRVISIDGEKPVEDNVSLIKKELFF